MNGLKTRKYYLLFKEAARFYSFFYSVIYRGIQF